MRVVLLAILALACCVGSVALADWEPKVQRASGHWKVTSTDKDDLLCAEWDGRRKCVTAQQIYFIGAKDRQ